MALIPEKYLLEEGKEQPEGTVVHKCKYCGRSFAVPKEESEAGKMAEVCDNDKCKELHDKEIGALTSALMKNPSEAKEAIEKALGTNNDVKVTQF